MAKTKRAVYHVTYVKDNGHWRVKGESNKQASGTFDKKTEAVARGKELAKGKKGDLVVHKQDGKVQHRFKYAE